MKEADAWYGEVIWEEDERLRKTSEEMQKGTVKRSEINNKLMLELQNWAQGKVRESIGKGAEWETGVTQINEGGKI